MTAGSPFEREEELAVAAVAYAAAGLPVLPLHVPFDGVCSCGASGCRSPGKHPRLRDGLKGATSDVAMVAEWWLRWPGANVGICTGARSGLLVLDVDVEHGGVAALEALVRERGPLPKTPEAWTGGGGRHYYFLHPGVSVRNSAGRLGDGLDVRGDGGDVVAAPSLHVTGRPYRWIRQLGDTRLAEPPPWLYADVREARGGGRAPEGSRRSRSPSPATRRTHKPSPSRSGWQPHGLFASFPTRPARTNCSGRS